ncbi:MAG: hypothetical protein JO011_16105 [Ktedonobacteraceae bacterium]|nr:hypothetical protein [Ktedonobacteraceae bacterium]MBV9712428.1 hypothetical protein [Ktedonobacteraceae bacterium]
MNPFNEKDKKLTEVDQSQELPSLPRRALLRKGLIAGASVSLLTGTGIAGLNLLATSPAAAAPAGHLKTNEMGTTLHVMAVFDLGLLEHNTREDNVLLGNFGWFPFEFIRNKVSGTPGVIESACATNQNGDLHILAVTGNGSVFHTIRFANGNFQSFWDGNFPPPDIRPVAHVACATNPNGDLHILALTRSGSLFHTIRFANGSIQSFWDGNFPPPDIRPVAQVACATNLNGDLHILALTRSGSLFRTIRFANGSIQPSWDGNFPPPDIRPVVQIACAFESANNLLHVCVVNDRPTSAPHLNERQLFYTNGDFLSPVWQPWKDVSSLLNIVGNVSNISISHT